MKVLVTGCFGFIGYNFIEFLKKNYGNDIKIYGIDKLTNSYSEYNSKKNNQIEFFKADINDINQIKDLQIDSLDGIFNFAAESHVDTSIYNPDIFINSNILGVSNLLQFSIKNNSKSFIHISTDEVYGSINKNFSLEDDKFFPSSPYSASKAGAEHIVKSYENTFGIDIKILRPANNFGKYQQPEKLIPFSFANLQYGGNIEIYGDGKNIRHWLYVQDTCKAIDFVFHKGRSGEAYNIGSGNYLTNLEISNKILGLMGLNEDRLEFVKDRPGHDFRYAVNTKKLESIGWSPDKDFDKQLYETIDWYKKNQDWWKKSFDKILSNRKKRYSLE
tara:strand:- start:8846 stop:9838 length:993 start_codon:yes stop_codon:yes gene_type:complete